MERSAEALRSRERGGMPNEATHPGASDILHFLEGFQAQAKVKGHYQIIISKPKRKKHSSPSILPLALETSLSWEHMEQNGFRS